ncbi:MAG: hypothetical protein ABIT37_00890 [Luteolibacter sp.]
MPKSITKNRKRRNGIAIQPAGFSKSLWDARNLISLGQNDQGLASLNQLAVSTKNPKRRAKILMLVGESQAKLSRHTEAAAAYSRAIDFARQAADLDLLLSSSSGQIRSLLRSLRTDEAKTAAAGLLAELDKAQQDYQKILNLTPAQLAANGVVQVTAQPPRPTVILSKIANAFIESGLMDDARVFLQKALVLSPNGAARARQSLAKLALASDDPALAERYAREALLMGRFQAKTIAAWQLYLDARARQNLVPILEPDVFASFQANATGRIASASIQSITRVLRGHGDPLWKVIAQTAITSASFDQIIGTELEKIIQSDTKLTGSEDPRSIAARSLRLFRAPSVSAQEQVAHAKAYTQYSLLASDTPNVAAVINRAAFRFGADHSYAIRHAMALAAMLSHQHDIARSWLISLLGDLTPGTEAWGKATWALARMESLLNRNSEAASGYFQIAASQQIPSRFRVQAMVRGFKYLVASGGAVDLPAITVSIHSLITVVDDYRVALDAARHLSLAGDSFTQLRQEAVDKGMAIANYAIANSTPYEGIVIQEYLARKQYWDLGDTKNVVKRWKGLSVLQKSEYQAVGGSIWFEYLALVFKSLVSEELEGEASSLAASIVNGDKSTPEGYVIIGNEYAEWLEIQGNHTEALKYFQWIAAEVPGHRKAAHAHYILALRSYKNGMIDSAKASAYSVRKCFGNRPALLSEWKLDCRAALILSRLGCAADFCQYKLEFVTEQEKFLASEMRW